MNTKRKQLIIARLKTWGWAILFLIAWALLQVILSLPFLNVLLDETTEMMFLGTVVSLLSTLIFVFIWTKFIHKDKWLDIGLRFGAKWKDLLWGMLYGATAITAGFLICWATGLIQVESVRFTPKLFLILLLFILVAFNEEILARGYLLRRFMTVYPKYIALGITALLFMSLHLANPNLSTVGMINLFLAGLLLGIYYVYRQNLWFPIGLHFTWNTFQAIFGYNVSGQNLGNVLVQRPIEGMDWLTGGAFGFEGSVLCSVIGVVCVIAVYLQYGRQTEVPVEDEDLEALAFQAETLTPLTLLDDDELESLDDLEAPDIPDEKRPEEF
ncbi:MAG: CPBP family intramembrane metalloprotease [Tannerella sp.]|nr:CPBP family intramembrane metalloprotease [Tannerella sp.]